MKKTNYNQLNLEQRQTIQYMIDKGHTFTDIGIAICKDRTTISKEIKRNRYVKSYFYDAFDPNGIKTAEDKCEGLRKPPYVCNQCKFKNKCNKHKLYYNAINAQGNFEEKQFEARTGVNISHETIDQIEHIIVPLIKNKKQSINQVYANHSDILYFSKSTFYNYIHDGILSLSDIDLPKKVIYKERKEKNQNRDYKRRLALLKCREYSDYINFVKEHPKMNICQMDTVVGSKESHKCLLTLIIVKTNFMIIRLLDSKTMENVDFEIKKIKEKLGIKLFSKVFRIVLTDNGTEFFNPKNIEIDINSGNKTCNVFYCKPYSSWQKGCIEKNHEYIRKFFPKGSSFDSLNQEQIHKLENIINNIPRQSLDNKTPYELTKNLYPDLISKLDYQFIEPDDVSLNPKDF